MITPRRGREPPTKEESVRLHAGNISYIDFIEWSTIHIHTP
jgi:hypothetical protein